jgi:hypothetical protein
MHSSKIHTAMTSLFGRAAALVAVAVVGLVLIAAGPASAQPKGGIAAKGCPVEDANGNTYTVPVGTRVGLFFCGSDGEWHFGWLVNARAAQPQPQPQPGITTAGVASATTPAVASP